MGDVYIPDARMTMPELFYPGRKPVGNVKIDVSNQDAKHLIYYHVSGRKDLVANKPNGLFGAADYERNEFIFDGIDSYTEMYVDPADVYKEEIAFYTEFTYIAEPNNHCLFVGNARDGSNVTANWTLEVTATTHDLRLHVGKTSNAWSSTPAGVHILTDGKSYKAMGRIANGEIEVYLAESGSNVWVHSGVTSMGGYPMNTLLTKTPRIGSAEHYGNFFSGRIGTVIITNDATDQFYAKMKKNQYYLLVPA